MRDLDVGRSARARLWLNEELPARYDFDSSQTETIVSRAPRVHDQRVALELRIARGGRGDYGLLGGSLAVHETKETRLTVGVVPVVWKKLDQLSRFETPLTYPTDSALIGLLAEFGKPVLEGASSCPCPPGTVLFDSAAFTATGSNIWVFRYLGSVIMRLLVLDDHSESNLVKVNAFRSLNTSGADPV